MTPSNKRRIFLAAWFIALAAAASVPALALVRGTVWFGPGAFISTHRLNHPLLSIGGDVRLPHGSNAIVLTILGSVHVAGPARDDIAAVGAPIYLQPGASVNRDVIAIGSSVYRADHVKVSGRVGGDMVHWSGRGEPGSPNWLAATWHYSGLSFAAGLALLLLSTLIALAFPWPTVLVSNYLFQNMARSLLAGFMGVFLFVFLIVPLGLSLFGLPFAILLAVVAVASWLLGLTAFAVTIGRHAARIRKHDAGLLWTVVSGMALLAVAGAIPWVGSILVGLAGATGAGALALTMIARARSATPPSAGRRHDAETIVELPTYIDRPGMAPSGR